MDELRLLESISFRYFLPSNAIAQMDESHACCVYYLVVPLMTIYINSLALYNEKVTGYLCFLENTTMKWSENGTLSKMCMKNYTVCTLI